MRKFASGALRDTADGKFEFLGFMHPVLDHSFASYMHEHRKMPDGSMRDSNNWWSGFGKEASIQSLVRHVEDLKAIHAGFYVYEVREESGEVRKEIYTTPQTLIGDMVERYKLITVEDCCNAIRFGTQAYLLEELNLTK